MIILIKIWIPQRQVQLYCRSKVNASSLAGCQVLHAAPLWRLTHPLTPASQSNTLTVKSFWVPSDLNHQVFSWNTLGNRNILFVAFVYTTSQGTYFYKTYSDDPDPDQECEQSRAVLASLTHRSTPAWLRPTLTSYEFTLPVSTWRDRLHSVY